METHSAVNEIEDKLSSLFTNGNRTTSMPVSRMLIAVALMCVSELFFS
jgi:hypothetical protein